MTSNREQVPYAVPSDTESGYAFPDGRGHFRNERWMRILGWSPELRSAAGLLGRSFCLHSHRQSAIASPVTGWCWVTCKFGPNRAVPFELDLYSLEDDRRGAFSAGPTFESREYFRGGNTRKNLSAALAKAFHRHLRSHGASPSDKLTQWRTGATESWSANNARLQIESPLSPASVRRWFRGDCRTTKRNRQHRPPAEPLRGRPGRANCRGLPQPDPRARRNSPDVRRMARPSLPEKFARSDDLQSGIRPWFCSLADDGTEVCWAVVAQGIPLMAKARNASLAP